MDNRLLNRLISKTSAKNDPPLNVKKFKIKKTRKLNQRPILVGYSRYVLFMKLLLPTIAFGMIGLIFLWPQIKGKDTRFSIDFKNVQDSDSENLNMINARFVGTDAKNQPFSITADMAKTLVTDETSIELEMPKADIGIDDGTWFAVIANDGIYNQKIQTLELVGDVNLFHDSGYEFNTAKVTIDLVKGVAISDVVINGHGPFGNVTAEGFLIGKENNQFLFTGKSKLVVKLDISKNINQK
jgi:lipopolysaccharide export system protein LptC